MQPDGEMNSSLRGKARVTWSKYGDVGSNPANRNFVQAIE